MLTEKQRAYLVDGAAAIDADEQSQKTRNYRANIRQRVKDALADFDTLAATLEERDIEQIFHDPQYSGQLRESDRLQRRTGHEPDPYAALEETPSVNYIPSVIAFLYLGTIQERKAPSRVPDHENPFADDPRFFADLVETGIERAYTHRRNQVVEELTVSIDLELGPTADELNPDDLAGLSHAELGALLDTGEISIDEFLEASDASADEGAGGD